MKKVYIRYAALIRMIRYSDSGYCCLVAKFTAFCLVDMLDFSLSSLDSMESISDQINFQKSDFMMYYNVAKSASNVDSNYLANVKLDYDLEL